MEKEGYPAGPPVEMKGATHMGAGHPPQYHETEGAEQQPHPHGYPPQGAPMGAPQGYTQGPPMSAPQGYPQGPHHQRPQGTPVPSSTLYPAGTQQTIVIQQRLAPTEYVESYLAWSILNCIFCCWILGIIAIVMSCTARSDNDAGNVALAKSHAKAALGLNIAGTLIGVIAIIVVIVAEVA